VAEGQLINQEEHRGLREGDRVSRRKHPNYCDFDRGTITRVSSEMVEITWDEGYISRSFHDNIDKELTKMFEVIIRGGRNEYREC